MLPARTAGAALIVLPVIPFIQAPQDHLAFSLLRIKFVRAATRISWPSLTLMKGIAYGKGYWNALPAIILTSQQRDHNWPVSSNRPVYVATPRRAVLTSMNTGPCKLKGAPPVIRRMVRPTAIFLFSRVLPTFALAATARRPPGTAVLLRQPLIALPVTPPFMGLISTAFS